MFGNFLTPVILVILFATLCLLAYTVYVLKRNMNAMKENMLEHSMILQRVLTNGGGTETLQRQNNENVDTELNNKIVVSDNDSDSSDSDSSDSDSSATESDSENEDEENNEMLSKKITLDGSLEENNVKQEDDESDDESDSEQDDDDDDDDKHGLMNIANHLNVSSESDALNLETVVVKKNNSDNTLEKQIKEKLYEDATYDLGPLTLDDSIDVETDETMTLNKKEETNDSSDSDSSDSDSSDSDSSDSDDENLNTVNVSETKDTEKKMIQMPLNEQSDTLDGNIEIATKFKKLKVSVLREMVYNKKLVESKNKAKKLKKEELINLLTA